MNNNEMYLDYTGQPIQGMEPQHNMMPMSAAPNDKADLLDKIRPELIVEVIRHKLMGEELIGGEWKPVPALKYRSLSDVGAWEIANLMMCASSQNVAISSLKDEEIKPRLRALVRAAMYKMIRNYKEYGIKGTDQFDYVRNIVYTNTLVTLKQPEHGGIRKMIMGVRQEQVSFKEGNDNNNGSRIKDMIFRKR